MLRVYVGYSLTWIVAPVVGYLVGKHVSMELAVAVASGVGGLGSKILRDAEPAAKAPPAEVTHISAAGGGR